MATAQLVRIGARDIGPGWPVFLASEIGVTAMGRLARAAQLIDATAEAGADGVKFIVADPVRLMEPHGVGHYKYEVRSGGATITRRRRIRELLAEGVFADDAWPILRAYAEACGLLFFVTVTDLEAIPMLRPHTQAWKVAAWDVAWVPLHEALRATGLPMLVDVGTATAAEAAAAAPPDDEQVLYVHSPHPEPDGSGWRLGRLDGQRAMGFSSPGRESWCDFVALGAGACFVEKRLTLERDHPEGHHHAISLEPAEFADWVASMRRADAARREARYGGSPAAWAERRKYSRNARGLRP